MTRRRIRRILEALGLAGLHRWNETGYRVIALHMGEASNWRFGRW